MNSFVDFFIMRFLDNVVLKNMVKCSGVVYEVIISYIFPTVTKMISTHLESCITIEKIVGVITTKYE